MHDFDISNTKAYSPTDYGLPVWRDEDHLPPQETVTAEKVENAEAKSGVIQSAMSWAFNIAEDNSHGYSQANRWGPDYDCSSFAIKAYQEAGLPLKEHGANYTGDMYAAFRSCGFQDVTKSIDLNSGNGLRFGDVLLSHNSIKQHAALYAGDGKIVHARTSEGNTKTGDQSGNEIRVQPYYGPWDYVLRFTKAESVEDDAVGTEPGESEIVGKQRIYTLSIPYLRKGDTGDAVWVAQTLLQARNVYCGPYGADSDFGNGTEKAVMDFQRRHNLTVDGVVGPETGAVLFGGEVYAPDEAEPKADSFWNSILTKIRERGSACS